jgi:cation diffusion facilitator family transporter
MARDNYEQEHDHKHSDDHAHDHEHSNDQEHDHEQVSGLIGWLRELLPFGHGHSHAGVNTDSVLEGSERGIWALKLSLIGLGLTAALQLAVVLTSGSVGLLADTIHNFADALTAVPLWIAFSLSRRSANRQYTYGYGRAEDIAGLFIVLVVFLSTIIAAYVSVTKLLNPQPVVNLGWVAVASVIGFLGNEVVGVFRIRVGNEIGSAALVADGQHARTDGLTSLAVLIGVIGVWLGFPQADPLVGLLITIAILFILKDTSVAIWRRLMDAVEPQMVEEMEQEARAVAGVIDAEDVRLRWLGHQLRAELNITVNEDLSTADSHHIAELVRHQLFHHLPRLSDVTVHVNPGGHSGSDHHSLTAHHRELGNR